MNVKIPVYCAETTSYVNLQKNIYIYIYIISVTLWWVKNFACVPNFILAYFLLNTVHDTLLFI